MTEQRTGYGISIIPWWLPGAARSCLLVDGKRLLADYLHSLLPPYRKDLGVPSERVQRQLDRLLDEAEQAVAQRDWDSVRTAAQDALDFDPENVDAADLLSAAQRALARAGNPQGALTSSNATDVAPSSPTAPLEAPASFANGRYAVKRFLGEGGKKKVYLAHDTLLDRDVAFALIKTEGLDEAAREPGSLRLRKAIF